MIGWFLRRRRRREYFAGGRHALAITANALDAAGEHRAASYVRAAREAWGS